MEGWLCLTDGTQGKAKLRQRAEDSDHITTVTIDAEATAIAEPGLAAGLPMGDPVSKPPWLFLERQSRALCAVHALNNLAQREVPDFSQADLREEARLARMADIEAQVHVPLGGPQERHEGGAGNFTYQAVGYALRYRRCDWRSILPRTIPRGIWIRHPRQQSPFWTLDIEDLSAQCLGSLYIMVRINLQVERKWFIVSMTSCLRGMRNAL